MLRPRPPTAKDLEAISFGESAVADGVQAAMLVAPAQPAEVFCVASHASVRARCLRLPPNN